MKSRYFFSGGLDAVFLGGGVAWGVAFGARSVGRNSRGLEVY